MLDSSIQKLIVSPTQIALDHEMVPYDIWGTTAHVLMLNKTGIVDLQRSSAILKALQQIQNAYDAGDFSIDPDRGAQLTLEKEIVERAGEEAGYSTHTSRSRNDQVMVTEMLYLREQTIDILERGVAVLEALLPLAQAHTKTVMPGYTHMQPGKPTTFAHWCLAHGDSIHRGLLQVLQVLEQYDMCPLGSVESFGSSWPIDREYTAALLGFEQVWEVPQDAISNRGVFQLSLLAAFSNVGIAFGRLASDLMLYSTFEYNMVGFGEAVAKRLHPITGSSVMAQKKNPDALELIRSTTPQFGGLYQAAFGVLSNLPTGYNRDSREVKEYIGIGLQKMNLVLAAAEKVLSTLDVNTERMRELVDANYSLTTDLADYLSQSSGVPYRIVYKIVGLAVDEAMQRNSPLGSLRIEEINSVAAQFDVQFTANDAELVQVLDPEAALAKRQHRGGTAPECTAAMQQGRVQQVAQLKAAVVAKRDCIAQAHAATIAAVDALLAGAAE